MGNWIRRATTEFNRTREAFPDCGETQTISANPEKRRFRSAEARTKDRTNQKGGPSAQVQGGQITFPCRWCQASISVDVSRAGKLLPCPKCELLVSVPKITT